MTKAIIFMETAKNSDEKIRQDFAQWWKPHNGGGEPNFQDPFIWEKYQYYCAGRLDEHYKNAKSPNDALCHPAGGDGGAQKELSK